MNLARLLLLAALLAQEPNTLVEQLRAERAETRDAAERGLRLLGRNAWPELERAAADSDLEAAARARAILNSTSGEAAQETLERLEAVLLSARSLKIRFQVETVGLRDDDPRSWASGEILMWNDGRLRAEMAGEVRGNLFHARLVSDGRVVRSSGFGLPGLPPSPTEIEADDELAPDLKIGILRGGAFLSLSAKIKQIHDLGQGDPFGYDRGLKRLLILPDPELLFLGTGERPLQYRFRLRDERDVAQHLRYDLSTGRLLERDIQEVYGASPQSPAGKEQRFTRESYDEFALNLDLPDELFEAAPRPPK